MEPVEPFSPPPTRRGRRGGGTRIVGVQVAVYAAVVGTAVALVLYFALR